MGNAFAAGIFLAVALMDLLPDSVEDMAESGIGFTDLTYILVITGYILILTLEKIIFDSHSVIDHRHHSDSTRYQSMTSIDMQRSGQASSNLDEIVQAVINPRKSFSMVIKESEHQEMSTSDLAVAKPKQEHSHSDFTPYLLAIALSVHSVRFIQIFEGIAIGLQESGTGLLNLAIGVGMHKIPACLALSLSLAQQPRKKALIILCIFVLASPIGVAAGILLAGQSVLVQAIFLSLSCGTFIYIAASEIIVEEFSVKAFKIPKYLAFLLGVGFFTGLKVALDATNPE
jgi:zinc transporter ZupT